MSGEPRDGADAPSEAETAATLSGGVSAFVGEKPTPLRGAPRPEAPSEKAVEAHSGFAVQLGLVFVRYLWNGRAWQAFARALSLVYCARNEPSKTLNEPFCSANPIKPLHKLISL